MNKKLTIIIGATAILIGIFGWQMRSFSQEDPFDKLITDLSAGSQYGADLYGIRDCETDACCVAYKGAMGYIEKGWSENLASLTDQEKPASEMVDEAYESLRSYQCQLEYICRAVEYSGYANPENIFDKNKLTSKHIGVIPGCQKPEDIGMVTTWGAFMDWMEQSWDYITFNSLAGGTAAVDMEFPDTFFAGGGVPFIPQCMSDITNKNAEPDFVASRSNYQRCVALLDSKFACEEDEEGLGKCSDKLAFIQVETALKKAHADQKTRALENKLSDIITKMITMEMHAEYLKTKLQNLDQLYACYPSKCD